MLIKFIMSTLTTPYMFCVGQGVVPEVFFFPRAGIGQGDPFSPVLFSFCGSFLLHRLSSLKSTDPYLYVGDYCVLPSRGKLHKKLPCLLEAMEEFKVVLGLTLNLDKCGIVLKGTYAEAQQERFADYGIAIRDCVKYLGVLVGHITTSQAFAKVLGETQRRASLLGAFPFSLLERIQLLKVWILPCLPLTTHTYCLDDMVGRSLKTICKTALGLDSWRITLTQFSPSPEEGGYSLAMPDTWLKVQAGLAFVKYMSHPESFLAFVGEHLQIWDYKFGAYLQLGPITNHTMGYLVRS